MNRISLHQKLLIGFSCCGSMALIGYFGLCMFFRLLFMPYPFDMNENPFDNAAFNKKIWDEDASCSDSGNRRFGMADDIRKNQLKPGMTPKEVAAILGISGTGFDPKASLETLRKIPDRERYLGYYLGEEIGSDWNGKRNIDLAWMRLYFDADGHYTQGNYFTP